MKLKSLALIVFTGLAGVALGAFIGYATGKNTATAKLREDRERFLHEAFAQQAIAHLKWLQASEGLHMGEVYKVRKLALVTLQIYVEEVDDLTAEFGADWPGVDRDLYVRVKTHLAKRHALLRRLEAICEHLAQSAIRGQPPVHPGIVRPVGWLDDMAEDMRNGYQVRVIDGDAFREPETATHSALFAAGEYEIGHRFRYDAEKDKFHMVGYWTIREPGR